MARLDWMVQSSLPELNVGGRRKRSSPSSRRVPALQCQWQQLSVVAHNLLRIPLDTLAEPKPRSRKRRYTYLIRSMRTLRFLLIIRAGRLTRIGDRHVLRPSHKPRRHSMRRSIAACLSELFWDWG